MTLRRGYREGVRYNTNADSFVAFKKIWREKYGAFPNSYTASRWTGNDKPTVWLSNVRAAYNNYTPDKKFW